MIEDLLTPDELAGKLKISRPYVYKLVREKRIPYFHINKAVRFSPSDIEKWLEEKRGQEYHRDGEKEGAKVGGLARGDAPSGGENKRKPDTKTGERNQQPEMII